ncbi:YchF family ATPase [Desulfococcaceae bacterium OttesenSCG-928-F15]|nr:YchF family ATPase [Desulfococcaceae bacterium OttesenSCG-928-F15]
MKVGITGLSQSGKKTLFTVLTGIKIPEGTLVTKGLPGTADILDPRFDKLVSLYEPKKEHPARIDFVLLPKLEKEALAKGSIFQDIADMDAICLVVRAFSDEAVFHEDGSVNALRDLEKISAEFILHDQLFVEKRMERLELALRKIKDENQKKEFSLMQRMQAHLEEERPLRFFELSEEEDGFLKSYPLITRKEMLLVLNIGEDALNEEIPGDIQKKCQDLGISPIKICTGMEAEIALLEDPEEKAAFLEDLGIPEPGLGLLTRTALQALGRISFFTVGKDEVRQWLLRKDSPAPKAAGVIHSDLERGFIRAEVMKYDELMALGNENEVKKAGKLAVNGKDYLVQDGDILNIRFKV